MCDIAKEKLESLIEGMTLEEQEYALHFFRTELLWNEVETRLKDALEYKEKLKKYIQEEK